MSSHKKLIQTLILGAVLLLLPVNVSALYRPQLIVAAKQQEYEQKVSKYTPTHHQMLTDLNKQIIEVNRKDCALLEAQIAIQGAILDEYFKRNNFKTNDSIDKARYWLTYAHEAVAFQIAKVYIFDLNGESNIKGDARATVNLFENDLASARTKTINSQKIIQDLVKSS